MDLLLSLDDMPEISKLLNEAAIKRAWTRTLSKSEKRIMSVTAKRIAPVADLPQKAIKTRLKAFRQLNDKLPSGKIWLGLNPISAHHAGALRNLKNQGLKVRKHHFKSGFFIPKTGNKVGFERASQARYPIKVITIDWSDEAESAFAQAIEEVKPSILKTYQQELNYELLKATKQL